jgi:putative restriction endonuclease
MVDMAMGQAADRTGWLEQIGAIKQWSRGGERAPHKPLLLLYLLGRLQRTGSSRVRYADVEADLQDLLGEFGPPRKTSPAYPFHHLQRDGLWRVQGDDGTDPGTSVRRLRAVGWGELDAGFARALTVDPGLAVLVARSLLDANFPETLHPDICALVGLDLDGLEREATLLRLREVGRRRRDPAFRPGVLMAYEHRCAMCGYDGRLGATTVALDAAHVRWHALDGPDELENAVCLCTLHHKLFDLGAIGISDDRSVVVSAHFAGRGEAAARLVTDLVGRPLQEPQPGMPAPIDDHVGWHQREVFRPPARQTA